MNRWLRIIILTLLVVLKSTATMSAATFAADDDHKIQEWFFEHQQRPQAIISDSSQTFRLCSSRPQRVIPAEYAKQVQRYSFRLQSSNLEKLYRGIAAVGITSRPQGYHCCFRANITYSH